jgi:Uma2 family endonuclease
MNLHIRQGPPPTTQAAEGMPRRAWTVAEIEAAVAAGIITENERFELIGGEIVPMSPKGAFHETVKKELNRHWTKLIPPEVDIVTETTFRIGEHDFLEPDFVFWPRALGIAGLKPDAVQLVVEIADSSLAYDIGRKAAMYAVLNIPDYWVINARTLTTHIHSAPTPKGFTSITEHKPGDLLTPAQLPALCVRLTDLGLKPTDA